MSDAPTVVCFDIGGVLVEICRGWDEACKLSGLPLREPERLLSDAFTARRRAIIGSYQVGALDCEAYYQAMSGAVDGLYTADEVRLIHHVWTQSEYPGIAVLIDDLESRSMTTACLSNTNHAHWVRLSGQTDPLEYPSVARLRYRLASHLLGAAKPDAGIYRHAQAVLGVASHEIVFFDDLADNVAAARAMGWRAFLVDPAGDPAAEMRRLLARLGVF